MKNQNPNKTLTLIILLTILVIPLTSSADYQTPNFVIQTQDSQYAKYFANLAEEYRVSLSQEFFGDTMPKWDKPLVANIYVNPSLGAGGQTKFYFQGNEVYGWKGDWQGSAERIADSVIPHEIMHTVLASKFREPLPRWLDEGIASSVEHESEKLKHKTALKGFLQTGRGISFNKMFTMKEYPSDVMPLYAQGATLTEFLIQQGGEDGKKEFIKFVETGMKNGNTLKGWNDALKEHYPDYENLGELQDTWVQWVASDFQPICQD